MARVSTSDNFTSGKPGVFTANGPLSRWLSALRIPARGLSALVPGFVPRSGLCITPRLRLLYPLRDGYRVEEAQLDRDAALTTWVADHLGLATRVEVTFANPRSTSPEARASFQRDSQAPVSVASASAGGGAASSGALAAAAAFQARAQVTAHINEPHLVHILEQGNVKGLPFIVTELLEGKSLRQRLLQGPAPLAEVQTVVLQACDALAKAHSFGIAHGGLCPDVLYLVDVAEQPFLKIAGFGLSAPGAEAPLRHTYASPEQLLLDVRSDARSDLWALAVTAYELLTTTLPFEATTPAGVAVAICNGQFAQPSHYRADLPRAIDGWFAAALAKDPARRFADAAELARGFVQALTASVEAAAVKPSSPISKLLSSPSFPDPGLADALEPDDDSSGVSSAGMLSSAPPLAGLSVGDPSPEALSLEALSLEALSLEALSLEALSPEAVLTHARSLAGEGPGRHGAAQLSSDVDDDSLEMDDGEEDEKTVKWDSPSELANSYGRAPAAILASVVPHPLGGRPNRVSAAIPGIASARQGAVTQRVSLDASSLRSSPPLGSNLAPSLPLGSIVKPSLPLGSNLGGSVALGFVPPTLEPGVYLDSPYIASVASALAVPSTPLVAEGAPRAQPFFTADKTWLAALAFAAGVAVTWFAYEPASEGDAAGARAGSELGPDGIRTLSVNDLPPVAGEAGEDDLPAIVKPSQLPRATDEAGEPRQVPILSARALTAPAVKSAVASEPRPTVQKMQALTPAKAAARPKAVTADARSSCSPPYEIDGQGVQRLKAECGNRPAVIAGPYGAVMTTSPVTSQAEPAKTAATNDPPPRTAPAKPATSDKQARSSASCSPPYYFDGKIRRLKLECL